MEENRKIKVLLVSPGAMAETGGIARWTEHILNYYNEYDGNKIIIQHLSYSKAIGGFATDNIIIRLKKAINNYVPLYKEFINLITHNNFNVVHFCSSASISLIKDIVFLNAAHRRGLKTIIHFRFGRIPDVYKRHNWEQKLLHKVIIKADKTIVLDKMSYNTLILEGYKNIVLLPNPLTLKVSEIIKENKNIKRQDRTLVFAGHVVPTKGVFELIDACKKVQNIKLKMLGFVSTEMKQKLEARAGKNYLQWLEILGQKDFETTIKEMLSAGVFVLPTYTEGFPNVIIESMACACPIVTTKVGAIPEMLDIDNGNQYGICVEPQNVEQLRIAIQRMLDDRKFAIQCGKNAQKRVNEIYSIPKVWDRMVNIWESTLK